MSFVQQQAAIVEEQSKTIREQSIRNDKQSALIEVSVCTSLKYIYEKVKHKILSNIGQIEKQ